MVGGGSGGHVTPLLAVANELHKRDANLDIQFWCDRAYRKRSESLFRYSDVSIRVKSLRAGKLRRYNATSFLRQVFDIPTVVHNAADVLLVIAGFLQAFWRLVWWRPKVIFLKGGFVCLPVGWAARLLFIPYVIHDSDAHPGLTNRLLAPGAKMIATGAPLEYYKYPEKKAVYVGIPTQISRKSVPSREEKSHLKSLLKLPADQPLVVVTGGGLGAKRINDALVKIAPELLKRTSIIHLSGQYQYASLISQVPHNERYKLIAFVDNVEHMTKIVTAADVVVSRAGATSMAELAGVAASVIIIPNDQLTGGHQTKNAKVFTDARAAISVDEKQFDEHPEVLLNAILYLLDHPEERQLLSERLAQFARPDASTKMVDMIISVGRL